MLFLRIIASLNVLENELDNRISEVQDSSDSETL
jgi:hypothetical protein